MPAIHIAPAVMGRIALAVAAVISIPVLQRTMPVVAVPARVVVQFRLADTAARDVAYGGCA
jgi:hypothetical protein